MRPRLAKGVVATVTVFGRARQENGVERLLGKDIFGRWYVPLATSSVTRAQRFLRMETPSRSCATSPMVMGDLFVQTLLSSEARRVTSSARHQILQVAWTPDGRELLFVAGAEGALQLWRVLSAGGDLRRVAVIGENIVGFALSRAAERLVYVIDHEEVDLCRTTSPAGGSPKRPQRWFAKGWEFEPRFSPDRSRVAFQSTRTGYTEVWIANADGKHPTQLTNQETSSGGIGWSPDGRILAFYSMLAGNSDILPHGLGGRHPEAFHGPSGQRRRTPLVFSLRSLSVLHVFAFR